MFALERVKIIKKYLIENHKAEVATLSDLLNVTEVTIRRDLEKLEREEFLKRIHGGAILIETEEESSILKVPEDPFLEDKQEIGQIASLLVEDNDVIMITQGPTSLQLARNLGGKKNLTVLTNDLMISLELSSHRDIKVILLGGDLEHQSKGVYGNYTINSLKNFFVSKTFFEVEGINLNSGLTVSSIEKANLIQEAVKISRESICLCSGENFGNIAFYPVGRIGMASKLVTNPAISDEYKSFIYEEDIQLFTSIHMYEGHA
ncbi:MAG: DeoR/GlpR family DNA-binding transcription regulator [Spirochaetales bacterium]|nr:DeoR/GlpR family DNA-binding transcription regulator [Spirochaetales bacterium]